MRFWKFGIFAIILFIPFKADASYIESCELGGAVVSIEDAGTNPDVEKQFPFFSKTIKFKVERAKTLPGSHANCEDRWVGKTPTKTVYFVSAADFAAIREGEWIPVRYEYSNWISPSGPGESESAFYNSKEYKAYSATISDFEVAKATQRLRQRYAIGDRQSFLGLDIGLVDVGCGVAGCDEVYMVTLKYGWNGVNSHLGSVVALVPFQLGNVKKDAVRIIYESGSDVPGGRFWKPELTTLTKVQCGSTSFNQWTFELNTEVSMGKAKYQLNQMEPVTCDTMQDGNNTFVVSCQSQEFILEKQSGNAWNVLSNQFFREDCSVPVVKAPFQQVE